MENLVIKSALKNEIHPEVHAKWGHFECHCKHITNMRLSKTARNMNKVFLTCGVPYNREEKRPQATPCKYFQRIHTALYPLPSDPIPEWLVTFTASNQLSSPSMSLKGMKAFTEKMLVSTMQ